NFDALEPEQVDVLAALNTDSLADGTGALDDQHLTGFGMGPDRLIGNRSFAGGITYHDIELLRVDLGNGNDSLVVHSTHGAVTLVGATGGTFRLNVGGLLTAPLPYLAGAGAVKAAILALGLGSLHITDVVVNRAGDTFTIGFLGDESLALASSFLDVDVSG